jgi:hypothetical protein
LLSIAHLEHRADCLLKKSDSLLLHEVFVHIICKKMLLAVAALIRETLSTSWTLLKITVPVVCVTKILQELGAVDLLSSVLDPVMAILGLPGALGLVWATAMLTNIYGGMVVYAALAPELALSSAQATVICAAVLIAHALPLELAITKKSGVPFLPILFLRLLGGFCYALLLNLLFSLFQLLQKPAVIIFSATAQDPAFLSWLVGQLKNFCLIIAVIFCVLTVMKVLRVIGLLAFMERMLEPVLPFFGMSRRAAPVTVVGMIMGISYGGALIIREANSGHLARSEVFFSLALMALCHSVIEDTLLMVALGAHWSGVLLGRILFSLTVIYLLALISRKKKSEGVKSSVKDDR